MMARRIGRTAAALSLSALLSGCITTAPFDAGRKRLQPTNVGNVIVRTYDERGDLLTQQEPIEDEKRYSVTRITIPADEHAPETVVDYYRAKITGERPVLIMSPPLGTSRPGRKLTVERPFLTYFAKNGWDAALVYRPRIERTKDPFADLERGMTDSVASYRHAITHVLEMPDVRADRLCALGISMGGILTTIVAAQDERIKYSVIALAGSTDLVLENIDDKNPEGFLRKIGKVMQEHGGKEQFMEEFRARVPTQPQAYASLLDPRDTMLFISKRDKVIPRNAAEDLRKRAGYPTTRYIHLLGHVWSFLLYPVIRHETKEFFEDRIAADDTADRAQAIAADTANGRADAQRTTHTAPSGHPPNL